MTCPRIKDSESKVIVVVKAPPTMKAKGSETKPPVKSSPPSLSPSVFLLFAPAGGKAATV